MDTYCYTGSPDAIEAILRSGFVDETKCKPKASEGVYITDFPGGLDPDYPDDQLFEITLPAHIVAVTFDWQPVITDGRARFGLTLQRGDRRSNVTFEINLNKLALGELERLHHFLVRRHLNATTHEEMATALCRLIDCSFRQTEPALNAAERGVRLRRLLLCREAPESLQRC
jgi:hypothetical protein